jgi:putative tricarboxylic transport membrane protein
MLTLGVPGSGTTAVLLALLISLNIQPGPMLFTQNAELVWGVIAALFVGNLIPLVPVIPGMLLGPEMEKSLRHALTISDGDWTILWSSGLSVGIWAVAILGLVLPYLIGPVLRRRMAAAQDKDHSIVD